MAIEAVDTVLVSMPCCGEVERLLYTGHSVEGDRYSLIYEGTHGDKLTVICKVSYDEQARSDAVRQLRSDFLRQVVFEEGEPHP